MWPVKNLGYRGHTDNVIQLSRPSQKKIRRDCN